MTTADRLDLRELIREHIATAESVHVRELSEGIAESVPSEELRDALRECLPHLVREVLNSTRPPVVVPAPAPAYSAKIARRCHGFADEGCPTVITAYINQHTTA